jgi:RNA polymerase sigma-70 factor (ECF subfamily)
VWLQAFRSRQGFDQAWSSARPWLYGIAANVLRAHWGHHSVDHDDEFEAVHDPWPEADGRLDAGRRWPVLLAALRDLDPEDRAVLLLVAWEHLTPTESALTLGIPAGTARWRLHRARTFLQGRVDRVVPIRPPLPYKTKEA